MSGRSWIGAAVCVALLGACTDSSSAGGGSTESSTAAASSPMPSGAAGGTMISAVAGTWQGTWTNTSGGAASGTFQIDWQQQGSKLNGTIAITGTPCLAGGRITGNLDGDAIDFGVVSGAYKVNYKGSLSGTTMSGTYSTDCGNSKGTWEASKAA